MNVPHHPPAVAELEPATATLARSGPRREPAPRTSFSRNHHRIVLALAIAVCVLALGLQVRPDQRVAFRLIPAWPLPELCQSKVLFGWTCPGCGLTRSFVHLAHADLPASLAVHPFGWLAALLVLAQIPYRVWALNSPSGKPLGTRVPWIVLWTVIALLVVSWLVRTVWGIA